MLVHETPANILLIMEFDALIWHSLECDYICTQPNLESVIRHYKQKSESSSDQNKSQQPQNKRQK
jgi:hypothetical protein